MLTQTPYVIGGMGFEGIILSDSWFTCDELKSYSDKFPEGKPNLLAIIILGELIRWYKPITVRDNLTLEILEVRNRFEGKVYKLHLNSWAARFGVGTNQIKESLKFLEEKGVVILKEEENSLFSIMPKAEVVQKITSEISDSFVVRRKEVPPKLIPEKEDLVREVQTDIPQSKEVDGGIEGIPIVEIDEGIPRIIS